MPFPEFIEWLAFIKLESGNEKPPQNWKQTQTSLMKHMSIVGERK